MAEEHFTGLVKTIGRRMLVSVLFDTSPWAWTVEHASDVVRLKTLKPKAKTIPFGYRVAVKLPPFGKKVGINAHVWNMVDGESVGRRGPGVDTCWGISQGEHSSVDPDGCPVTQCAGTGGVLPALP